QGLANTPFDCALIDACTVSRFWRFPPWAWACNRAWAVFSGSCVTAPGPIPCCHGPSGPGWGACCANRSARRPAASRIGPVGLATCRASWAAPEPLELARLVGGLIMLYQLLDEGRPTGLEGFLHGVPADALDKGNGFEPAGLRLGVLFFGLI